MAGGRGRRRGIVVVLAVVLVAGWLGWRKAYGEWLPTGDPPRLLVCGRTYLSGNAIEAKPSNATRVVAHYPPLVGRDVWGPTPLPSAPCSAAVFLETAHGFRGYGLSGVERRKAARLAKRDVISD